MGRGEHVDEITIQISGSKTDWLNRGCVRPHARVSDDWSNADICVARALIGLHSSYPVKFTKSRDAVFATWRIGDSIQPTQLTALIRSDVARNS